VEVKNMSENEEKHGKRDAQELKEILGAVSTEIPTLLKSILSSVFSEEAGKSMGKAAAAYYKELKNGGLPEPVAVKLTEDYMRTFTSMGDMLRGIGRAKHSEAGEEMGEEIEKRIREKLKKKLEEEE
jgi:hypothetical protein